MLGLIMAIAQISIAQVINVPEKSKKHFFENYPKATKVDWTNSVAWYTAKFKNNGGVYEAHYRLDGTWDYTEQEMTESIFPEPVKSSIEKSRFAGWEMKSTSRIENNDNQTLYRVEWKKGIERKYVFYDKTGKEIKSSTTL